MDLVLVAVGIRLALGGGGWTRAAVLLAGGLGLTVLADIVYNLQLLAGTYTMPGPVDAGWLLAYVLWAVAALDPSSHALLSPVTRSRRVSGGIRAGLLAGAVLMPLGVIADAYVRAVHIDGIVIAVTLAAIAVSMAARLRLAARAGADRGAEPACCSRRRW